MKSRNLKLEIRKKSETPNPKRLRANRQRFGLRDSGFGLALELGIGNSDFGS
jgi:hypothetical protein